MRKPRLPGAPLLLKRARWPEVVDLLQPPGDDPQAGDGALNNLAFALAKLGRNGEATAFYRRCVHLHPEYSDGALRSGGTPSK